MRSGQQAASHMNGRRALGPHLRTLGKREQPRVVRPTQPSKLDKHFVESQSLDELHDVVMQPILSPTPKTGTMLV